tara:strand:- start:453 stop:779 length:327 start_codon:yes stop_codon:yes gene_type:complete
MVFLPEDVKHYIYKMYYDKHVLQEISATIHEIEETMEEYNKYVQTVVNVVLRINDEHILFTSYREKSNVYYLKDELLFSTKIHHLKPLLYKKNIVNVCYTVILPLGVN